MIYATGRIFQLLGLLCMPSALWLGQFARDERGSIAVFAGSFLIFWLGWGLTRLARRS